MKINFTPGLYSLDYFIVNGRDLLDGMESATKIEILQGSAIRRPGVFPSHVKTFLQSKWRTID
jgi:hypothetical protein